MRSKALIFVRVDQEVGHMRSPVLLCGLILLVSALASSVGAVDYEDYLKSVDRAMQSGDGAGAIDIMCGWTNDKGASEYVRSHPGEFDAAMERWQAFQHRRYSEVFQPPTPVASYFPSTLPWEKWGFISSAFGSLRGTDQGESYNDGQLVTSDNPATIVVDLNRDGIPDLAYRGDEPEFNPSLAVVHDDARDGRRQQWLAASRGSDPRTAASIWLYRDGPALSIFVKPSDGPPCGRSYCFGGGGGSERPTRIKAASHD
jgi:hypothetical protein